MDFLHDVVKYVVDIVAQGEDSCRDTRAKLRSRGRSDRIRQSNGAINLARHPSCSNSICVLFNLGLHSSPAGGEFASAPYRYLDLWIHYRPGLFIRFPAGSCPHLLTARRRTRAMRICLAGGETSRQSRQHCSVSQSGRDMVARLFTIVSSSRDQSN
jgi:hypothetical protein